jgi:putative transposase
MADFQHGDKPMRLTVMVKLLPTEPQREALEATLRRVDEACDYVSGIAWETRTFGKYALQNKTYAEVKEHFSLTAQVVIRLLVKVSDAYKLDKRTKRTFRQLGAIAYDDRILSWREDSVSIWTIEGRQKMPFVCDDRTRTLLEHRRGESDLVYRGGKWYLLATVEVEEPPPGTPEDWLGVDLGIKNVAADSDGETYSGGELRGLRHRYQRIRSRLQQKGTKSAKRLLKKRRRKEHRMARDTNHRIGKCIVRKANARSPVSPWKTSRGYADGFGLEGLSGERCIAGASTNCGRSSSTRLSSQESRSSTLTRPTPPKRVLSVGTYPEGTARPGIGSVANLAPSLGMRIPSLRRTSEGLPSCSRTSRTPMVLLMRPLVSPGTSLWL